MAVINERVALARAEKYDKVVARLQSGWVVMGEVQFLKGYCLLLADPVVPTVNDLPPEKRALFLKEMTLVGDAVQRVTGAARINYEILGNVVTELHAHVFPRFENEPDALKLKSAFYYDWEAAPPYSEDVHGELKANLRDALAQITRNETA